MKFNTEFFLELIPAALQAIPTTLTVVIFALLVAFPLGFVFAVIRSRSNGLGAKVVGVFVSFLRGTPLIVQIYVIYTSMPLILADLFERFHINFRVFDINPLFYALLIFSLNTTAIFTEIFRSALATVGKGQMEAALMSGLSDMQAYRRIICPQTLRVAAANLCNSTLELVKNSTLVFYMSVMDIMGVIKTKAGIGYNYFEGYVLAFLIYLALCLVIQKLFQLVEVKAKSETSKIVSREAKHVTN